MNRDTFFYYCRTALVGLALCLVGAGAEYAWLEWHDPSHGLRFNAELSVEVDHAQPPVGVPKDPAYPEGALLASRMATLGIRSIRLTHADAEKAGEAPSVAITLIPCRGPCAKAEEPSVDGDPITVDVPRMQDKAPGFNLRMFKTNGDKAPAVTAETDAAPEAAPLSAAAVTISGYAWSALQVYAGQLTAAQTARTNAATWREAN